MVERVKSGIPGLDDLLNGGFPLGGMYVILGQAGTCKTILSTAFLRNGAVNFNEPGVYIMLEENKERMMSHMMDFGWDLAQLESEGKLKVIPYVRSIVGDVDATFENSMMSGSAGRVSQMRQYLTVDSLLKEITDTCKSIGAKRVVIDPINVVTLLSESQVIARMQIIWLLENLRKLDVTVLATVEEGVGYWEDTMFLSDGIVHLTLKERDGIHERGIMIRKIRGTSHDTSIRPVKIDEGGMRVYPEEVIFR
ncbi:MAG: hypothetical protein GF416_02145 [Candidatus Altiarchaeales archaeon]|nr:hypothetical protein [Candidatus Altiarchaeales archaeon]MBD3415919.1 hypothetical protein [Candidatus Altiarchaeales archaeon]